MAPRRLTTRRPPGPSSGTRKKKARAPKSATSPSTASGAPSPPLGEPRPTASPAEYALSVRFLQEGGPDAVSFSTSDREFYPLAQAWRYVIANRRRITRETRDSLSSEIFDKLVELTGLDGEALRGKVKAMARSATIEVTIPYEEETKAWAARVFPWESVIGLLTKPYREETTAVTVVRHLAAPAGAAPTSPPTSLLAVRSGPGEIGRLFDLERECQMVRDSLPLTAQALNEPDRASLLTQIKSTAPSIIHLAGVDPLALETYGLATPSPEEREGFVLRWDKGGFDCVSPLDLAGIVTAARAKPRLVAISTCFSASRVAALCAALGAVHAIGFQDTISDADALLFFSVFYRAWKAGWTILPAFSEARAQLMKQATSRAAGGVVLWSRHSLLAPPAPVAARARPAAPAKRADPNDLRLYYTTGANREKDGRGPGFSLNYSLLHNNRSPFLSFLVDKPSPGRLPPLRVQVALDAGGEACRCLFAEELPEEPASLELADKIRLPLVASLLRQCTESLRTNLYIRVECGERLICERNEPVSVLPADEWRDDGEDHRWLPSFVLPRDPAVLPVITAAQRYLYTLLDDCSAGFDGYQQLCADDANAADVVDPQVQAIWAALQHDLALNYINPPPSYTSQSQRLRSPSQIFEGKAATCIDLALLFASCLEYVGIYPVIFLVVGHAFPGYWRSDKAWSRMCRFGAKGVTTDAGSTPALPPPPERPPVTPGQGEGWLFAGIDNLAELLSYVQAGSLVPFESTFVTAKKGFFQALEQAPSRLHPDAFDAMIDVQLARGENVTPLPFLDRRR
jgi:hypothetical protein